MESYLHPVIGAPNKVLDYKEIIDSAKLGVWGNGKEIEGSERDGVKRKKKKNEM